MIYYELQFSIEFNCALLMVRRHRKHTKPSSQSVPPDRSSQVEPLGSNLLLTASRFDFNIIVIAATYNIEPRGLCKDCGTVHR